MVSNSIFPGLQIKKTGSSFSSELNYRKQNKAGFQKPECKTAGF
jgi:hypothetical protein